VKTQIDCISCKVRQAVDVVKRCTDDPLVQEEAFRKMLEVMARTSFDRPPVAVRRDFEEIIKGILGLDDPYLEHKRLSNEIGRKLFPELKKIVSESENPLQTAIRLAVTGNIIDYGMFKIDEVDEIRVRKLIDDSMSQRSHIDESERLITGIEKAENIWYIADNCGELFFDRVLIEEMPAEKITVVVRGNPILNDATLEDARETGLTDIVKVIDDGYDAPALILDKCSPDVHKGFFDADLVISKGQGNYEALSLAKREIFFLLMVKCEVVARDIPCNLNDIIIKAGGVKTI
jgi:damage-control phosphatase, subfamily I